MRSTNAGLLEDEQKEPKQKDPSICKEEGLGLSNRQAAVQLVQGDCALRCRKAGVDATRLADRLKHRRSRSVMLVHHPGR